jgi:excisionase family DNA binding protein
MRTPQADANPRPVQPEASSEAQSDRPRRGRPPGQRAVRKLGERRVERRVEGPIQPLVFTLDQVLELVPGLSRSELFRQIRTGNLPSLKVGRKRAIRRQDLERWIDERVELPA